MSISSVRRSDWKALAPFPLPGPTFAAQSRLPKLPVPELQQTLNRLKQSLKPIAWSDHEYDVVVSKIDKFETGLGPVLQQRLLKRREQTDHWLEEWWDQAAYLAYRDSVVVNVSYFYGFEEHPAHLPQSAVPRAAAIIRSALLFRQKFKLGQVQPETFKGEPLCMDTWRWMFDCCRVPGIDGLDWGVSHAKYGDTGNSGHIVVIRRGRFWKVDVSKQGKLLGTTDLEKQIQYVVGNTTHEYPAIGTLTASNRDVWAKDYQHLRSDPHNSGIIDTIESSAFIVCLDVERPSDIVDWSHSLWHGSVSHKPNGDVVLGLRNRWVDKPCQFIVFDNGKAGFMGEHSVMDGTPTVTLCDQVVKMLKDPMFDHGLVSETLPMPTPLDFNITSQTNTAITQATEAAFKLVDSQALSFHWTSYGKAAVKGFGISPDAWAQMIIQVAYAGLLKSLGQKRNGGTYESATTRKFYRGRTEVIRVITSESDAFVRAMIAPSSTTLEKRRLLKEASKAHKASAKDAIFAQGIDRHLLGLKNLMQKDEVGTVEMFDDPVYKRGSYWILSTSAIFSSTFRPYGWGEVVPDGFGVAYMTGFNDRIQFTLTSRKEMPNKQFFEEIKKAAEEMYELFETKGDTVKL